MEAQPNTTTALQKINQKIDTLKPKPTKAQIIQAMAIALYDEHFAKLKPILERMERVRASIFKKAKKLAAKEIAKKFDSCLLASTEVSNGVSYAVVEFNNPRYCGYRIEDDSSIKAELEELSKLESEARNSPVYHQSKDYWVKKTETLLKKSHLSPTPGKQDLVSEMLKSDELKKALAFQARKILNTPTKEDVANAIDVGQGGVC